MNSSAMSMMFYYHLNRCIKNYFESRMAKIGQKMNELGHFQCLETDNEAHDI